MSSWLLYNGQWIKDEAVLPVQNRAFQYGDGLFETMRTYGTEVVSAQRHFDRLKEGMRLLKLPMVPDLEIENLTRLIAKMINKNKWFKGARLRLTVFREGAGKYTPLQNETSYVLVGEPYVVDPFYPFVGKGRIMGLYTDLLKPVSMLSPIKTLNCLQYVLAGIAAREQGVDDCFVVNINNVVIETVNANLILLKDNMAISPGPAVGALDGTMRLKVLELVHESGMEIVQRGLTTEELLNADEIMLTNAVQGIVWVKGFGERRYYFEKSKQFSARLNNLLNN
jgi:branched-subunit amino acid aminotransferase/4-amino-4-deoxychorismate lyase